MPDNGLAGVRDTRYELPPVIDPTTIDGEPHEVAAAGLEQLGNLLRAAIGYAEKAEAMVRSAMMTEALTLPDNLLPPEGAGDYPGLTYELQATARAGSALALAEQLVSQAEAELAKPISESRRAF